MLKKLSITDIEDIVHVVPNRDMEFFRNTYLQDLNAWYAYGYYIDGVLTGISTVYFNNDSLEWYMLIQYADDDQVLKNMVSEVCKLYETMGIYRIFWLDIDYNPDDMKQIIPAEYIHYKECDIKQYGLPKTMKQYSILMKYNLMSTPSHVYMSVLPDEFRSF